MIKPALKQRSKESAMLYSKSGAAPVPVRYRDSVYATSHFAADRVITAISATDALYYYILLCLRPFLLVSLQMVLVTDGSLGIGKGSLRHSLQTLKQRGDDKKFPLPFPFPTKMFIMCLASEEEVPSAFFAS